MKNFLIVEKENESHIVAMQFEVKTNSNSARHYLIIIHSTAFFAEPCIFFLIFAAS